MGALLHHVALVQHQDQIGVLDGGQAVGDDEAGFIPHERRMAAWIWRSVEVSTLEVASSRISMRAS